MNEQPLKNSGWKPVPRPQNRSQGAPKHQGGKAEAGSLDWVTQPCALSRRALGHTCGTEENHAALMKQRGEWGPEVKFRASLPQQRFKYPWAC